MRGLLLKEWYAHRFIWLTALAVLIFGWFYNEILYLFMEPAAALLIAMLPIFSLHQDAVSRFDCWHLTLPVKRSRYADVYYLMIAGMMLPLLIVHSVIWLRSELGAYFAVLGALMLLCLLAPAVYLPVTFRFGIAAGRVAALVMILPYTLLILTVTDLWGIWGEWERGIVSFLSAGVPVVGVPVLLFAVSRFISARILNQAEY